MFFLVAWNALASANAQAPSAAPMPGTAEIHGKVEVLGFDKTLSPAVGAVVWVPGVDTAASSRPASMASRNKRFEPHVLAVSRGQAVSFANLDRVYHNVFSLSPPNEFDLGIYRKGASRSKRFESPGVVRVYCNIHPDMAGFVLVVDSDAFASVEADGSYRISGLPAGKHKVRVWDERAGERDFAVELLPGQRSRLDAVLDASSWKPFRHKNKYGKEYPPVTRDADRY